MSRQWGCKGENIYFGGKLRSRVAKTNKKKNVSFLSATTANSLLKCWKCKNTKRKVSRRHTQAHYWSFS